MRFDYMFLCQEVMANISPIVKGNIGYLVYVFLLFLGHFFLCVTVDVVIKEKDVFAEVPLFFGN